jgi:DNA gyrase B subunit, carboxyl terminus
MWCTPACTATPWAKVWRRCRCGPCCPQAPRYDAASNVHNKTPPEPQTPMKPTTHRLLSEQIEDAIETDRVFTALMSDDLEPRRDFIEANTLRAGNIDV